MIRLILYHFLIFVPTIISLKAQSESDTLAVNINRALDRYENIQDVDILFSVGKFLPEGIFVLNNSRTGTLDFDIIRQERTALYLRWLNEFLIAGHVIGYNPINYNPNDPKYLCIDTNSTIVIDPPPGYLEAVEHGKENCRLKNFHDRYSFTMELFNRFYRRSFLKHGKRLKHLEMMVVNWCEKNVNDQNRSAVILDIILYEARKGRLR